MISRELASALRVYAETRGHSEGCSVNIYVGYEICGCGLNALLGALSDETPGRCPSCGSDDRAYCLAPWTKAKDGGYVVRGICQDPWHYVQRTASGKEQPK